MPAARHSTSGHMPRPPQPQQQLGWQAKEAKAQWAVLGPACRLSWRPGRCSTCRCGDRGGRGSQRPCTVKQGVRT